jgi:PAS fold
MIDEEVEAVARAFYETLENARGWPAEPPLLKERFRHQARSAIAALEQHEAETRPAIKPLMLHGPLEAARSYLLHAADISILPASTFRAVLKGPSHTYDVANSDYFKLVGHRDLFNMSVREALPELTGQGYYELLDRVYETKETFVGQLLPIKLQLAPGSPLEERKIDLTYRPIQNRDGEMLGLFVEGCDRTEWGRA